MTGSVVIFTAYPVAFKVSILILLDSTTLGSLKENFFPRLTVLLAFGMLTLDFDRSDFLILRLDILVSTTFTKFSKFICDDIMAKGAK